MTLISHADGASVIHDDGKVYRPNAKGQFDVPDALVEGLRSHGFAPVTEVNAAAVTATGADQLTQALAENKALSDTVAEQELHIEGLDKLLGEAQLRIADLEATATPAKKGKAADPTPAVTEAPTPTQAPAVTPAPTPTPVAGQ